MSVRADSAPSFSEREFYLREFRGRTLALALPPPGHGGPAEDGLQPVAAVLRELVEGGARCLVIASEAAHLEGWTRRVLRSDAPRVEGEVWRALREDPCLGITTNGSESFPVVCGDLAIRLGLFKLVWLQAGGGLFGPSGQRTSFVHLDELRALLGEGEGRLASDPRLALWLEIAQMLEAGVSAINVCTPAGLDHELFSYAGSGTLFTQHRYISVRRLGVDDFDAAEDLYTRGVQEGYLAPRRPGEVDEILASGFGAFVEDQYLAGIGALLRPAPGVGEIASLYTLTRFVGEGVGASLVSYALWRAGQLGLESVYACTTSERVGAFFQTLGFRSVPAEQIPESKWKGYDPSRRALVRCYRADPPTS